jgi:hypothetical protein
VSWWENADHEVQHHPRERWVGHQAVGKVHSKPLKEDHLKWFYDSGLYDATKNGSVVMEAPIATSRISR